MRLVFARPERAHQAPQRNRRGSINGCGEIVEPPQKDGELSCLGSRAGLSALLETHVGEEAC